MTATSCHSAQKSLQFPPKEKKMAESYLGHQITTTMEAKLPACPSLPRHLRHQQATSCYPPRELLPSRHQPQNTSQPNCKSKKVSSIVELVYRIQHSHTPIHALTSLSTARTSLTTAPSRLSTKPPNARHAPSTCALLR
jgi:hypothetical protein